MKKALSPINRLFRLLLLICALQFSGQIAWADLWWPALGWSCDENARHLAVYPIYFDANKPMPESRKGFDVPMAGGWENAGDKVPVLSCNLGPRRAVEITRIKLKVPSPRGVCGAGAYSDYSVSINGDILGQFAIGCSGAFVVTVSENVGVICGHSVTGDSCRTLRDDRIVKLNALGQFEERSR